MIKSVTIESSYHYYLTIRSNEINLVKEVTKLELKPSFFGTYVEVDLNLERYLQRLDALDNIFY